MCPAAVTIGFENTTFIVEESVGMFDVFVSVINPPMDVPFFTSIDLVIQTIDGNASKDNYPLKSIGINFAFFSWRN